jgi:hypothetical protein
MKSTLLVALATVISLPAWSADPATAQPASYTAPTPTQEEAIAQFRNDLMASRADIMAKGLTLSAEQAAKFWPMFEAFQKEQTVVVDEQVKALKSYADHFKTLSDADALAYVNSLLERDQKMHDLRIKWLKKFQTAVPAKTAASAIQLDRRLGNVTQVQLSSQIPLIR